MKNFDLNIDKILENWEVFHAVRELIANAIDEQILTNTRKPMIFQDDAGWWHVRDFGRGLRYQDLIQTENPEKLDHANLIGKFGIGLKDALATFDRRGITVLIRSRHGDISLARVSKHSFEEPIKLTDGQTLLVIVKDGRVVEFTWDMGLPHVEFVKRTVKDLPAGAWVGTVSKIDGEVAAISSKYFYGYQMPAPEQVTTAVRALFK
jgi:hypothetical protein